MALRDELNSLVDEVRDEVIDKEVGLRLHTVVVRTRTWPGEPGRGVPVVEDLVLVPKPKVANPPPHLQGSAGGKYESGDRVVSKISATYTMDQLTGGDLPAGGEVVWLIDGEEYTVVGRPEDRYLGWRVQLRRRTR